jgi:hypothetical protein
MQLGEDRHPLGLGQRAGLDPLTLRRARRTRRGRGLAVTAVVPGPGQAQCLARRAHADVLGQFGHARVAHLLAATAGEVPCSENPMIGMDVGNTQPSVFSGSSAVTVGRFP